MALNVPVVELNGTDTTAGVRLAPPQLGAYPVAGVRLAPPQFGNYSPAGIRLPTPSLTNAVASTFSFTASGGAQGGGSAGISGDAYVFVASGGAKAGGAATIVVNLLTRFDMIMRGGAVAGGAAGVRSTWLQCVASGGARAGGAAGVSSNLASDRWSVVAATMPSKTLAGVIIPVGTGYVQADMPRKACSGALLTGTVAALSESLPMRTLIAFTAAQLAEAMPMKRLAAAGISGAIGTLDWVLPARTLVAVATGGQTARLNEILPARVLAAGVILPGHIGAAALELPRRRMAGTVLSGGLGELVARLPLRTISAQADHLEATAALVRPFLFLEARAHAEVADVFTAWALNLRTLALTQYERYAFNSFARFQDRYLAADASGIVQLLGDSDQGAQIIAVARTGMTDFGVHEKTAIDRALLSVRTAGTLVLRVITDDGESYEYPVTDTPLETLAQVRAKIGRGLRLKYWCFEISNPAGDHFELDALTVQPAVLTRTLGR